jgi:hypothetical protein
MDPAEARRQTSLILAAYDRRTDGVPGGTLGPSLFQHARDPMEYFRQAAVAGARLQRFLGSTHPQELLAAVASFERLEPGCRVRPVVHGGLPAAYNRALIFPRDAPSIVPIHEDLSSVRALAAHDVEIAGIDMVVGHNLYLDNRLGEGSLLMYGRKLSDEEKGALDRQLGPGSDIARRGFPYPQAELAGGPRAQLDVESGDYVVFRSDFPHEVASPADRCGGGFRVSWNGFFAPLRGGREVVYWT